MEIIDCLSVSKSVEKEKRVVIIPNSNEKESILEVEHGCIQASKLAQAGIKVYDPGYTNTAPCTSKITYIDGNAGVLLYRGYPIEDVAAKVQFVDTAWLLFHGELPNRDESRDFAHSVAQNFKVVPVVSRIVDAMDSDAHPMGILTAALAAWGTATPQYNPALVGNAVYENAQLRENLLGVVLGGFAGIAAKIFLHVHSDHVGSSSDVLPSADSSPALFSHLFLNAIGKGDLPPSVIRALDVLLVLHADHELNCSTATLRQLTSSGVDLFSALSGSVCALYGPLHGGATEAVLKMLASIKSKENVPDFLLKVKNREAKLMGFGHRVYRNYDPRAKLIRQVAHEILQTLHQSNPLIAIAEDLERVALSDEYFVSRKLYPNVDFYSGIIYSAIGFKPEFFPVLFALGRVAGWMSHWNEFLQDEYNEKKIARPQQVYLGPEPRTLYRQSSKL
mmetsp:Transcript_1881/g.3349  ORF Transcript_1881/g.3349 Transcript_1881/m.3349 type:complete len:449 (-) Transcript_1881:156-1502(-)|eukprot:CAMPEP_0182444168 /NCGR_PEP_ID=MMETSP1172-20130603/2710_1 /TAXON_ID=708627 /ORGANISM="Timspurckia oligopyrenoides, Strain CCMP3278" /LENGTH=448 /DNA_ID=CAMNT_0024639677 /DNA_START=69 /DNA_END=1415 /DNA_ORIENTATION=+